MRKALGAIAATTMALAFPGIAAADPISHCEELPGPIWHVCVTVEGGPDHVEVIVSTNQETKYVVEVDTDGDVWVCRHTATEHECILSGD